MPRTLPKQASFPMFASMNCSLPSSEIRNAVTLPVMRSPGSGAPGPRESMTYTNLESGENAASTAQRSPWTPFSPSRETSASDNFPSIGSRLYNTAVRDRKAPATA